MTASYEDAIAASQVAGLLQRLDQANRRIAELDQELRTRHAVLDALGREAVTRLRNAHSLSSVHTIFPAFGVGRLLEGAQIAERRKVWLDAMRELAIETPLADVYPHGGGDDPLAILVRGSGGYGDMLYLAMYVRALHQTFPQARIHVTHEHPGVASIFAGNPYVASATRVEGDRGSEFLLLAGLLDCFDLIADVRYAITYCAPPLSRIDPVWLAQANLRALPWQSFVRDEWPYLNNLFAKQVVTEGHTKYSFVAHTGNVVASAGNWGDFFAIEPWARFAKHAYLRDLHRPYVTVHHGADRYMADASGMQTKNLPLSTWREIVALLDEQGIATVQLGEAHESPIPGVTVDLRGKTQFPQTAQVIRFAQCHIDTEGGLVHLARAVGSSAVVAFGPTAERFFGYPENVNIPAAECGDCWWTTSDWAVRCPRDLPNVPCMASHTAASITAAARPFVTRCTDLALSIQAATGQSTAEFLLGQSSGAGKVVLCASDNGQALDRLAGDSPASEGLRLFDLGDGPDRPRQIAGNAVHPAAWDRIPADEATFDAARIALSGVDSAQFATLAFELARVLKSGASAIVHISDAGSGMTADGLTKAIGALPGARLGTVEVAKAGAGGPDLQVSIRFTRTAARPTPRKPQSATAGGSGLGKRVRALVKR
ncbi:MAG: glycosyltransferase family 9 protein [Proteobacteria bacterium]|nr:glycosyltransferase family 9 protein [Pseudomonadota bacterium]